jgi:hypothetical protein
MIPDPVSQKECGVLCFWEKEEKVKIMNLQDSKERSNLRGI